MPRKPSRIPKYCLHSPAGKAYCRISGKVVYLGTYDTPESRKAYARILAELAASSLQNVTPKHAIEGLTIIELCAAYLDHCEGYYRKNGQVTRHVEMVKLSIRQIVGLYGSRRPPNSVPGT